MSGLEIAGNIKILHILPSSTLSIAARTQDFSFWVTLARLSAKIACFAIELLISKPAFLHTRKLFAQKHACMHEQPLALDAIFTVCTQATNFSLS